MLNAISSIQLNECRCVIVMNYEEKVIGVFSQGDVLRAVLKGIDLHTPLGKLINPNFKYLNHNNKKEALELIKSGIIMVPIIDKEFRLKSVITFKDFLVTL